MASLKAPSPRPRRRSRAKSGAGAVTLDLSPTRYIARVERETGREIEGPIEPHELLVHAHRDNHPVEIATQFLASRFIQVTGNEALVKDGLKLLNRLGGLAAESAGCPGAW